MGRLGGLDKNISLALGSSGVMDGLVLAQTHENPRIKASETQLCIFYASSLYLGANMFEWHAGSCKQSACEP